MPVLRRLPSGKSLAAGLACVVLALAWQALTVHYNYGGNWTALFVTGGRLAVPPELAGEKIYAFADSDGYDGQFYHYMAHDPFLQKGLARYVDAPRMRYRRILVPLAAYLLAGGQDRFVDPAFLGVILLSVFLGAYWLSRHASLSGLHPAWGLAFLLAPATVISIDRLVVDMALASLVAGFALYARQGPAWKLYVVLVCATLTRETGIILLASYCFYLAWRRLPLKAVLYGTAALPALAWFVFVQSKTPPENDLAVSLMDVVRIFYQYQFWWLRPLRYAVPDFPSWALVAMDYLVMGGVVLAIVLGIRYVLRKSPGPQEFAGAAYALSTLWILGFMYQGDPYTFPRQATPLLFLVALHALPGGVRIGLLPIAMVLPRVAVQLGHQVLGVLRGLTGG